MTIFIGTLVFLFSFYLGIMYGRKTLKNGLGKNQMTSDTYNANE